MSPRCALIASLLVCASSVAVGDTRGECDPDAARILAAELHRTVSEESRRLSDWRASWTMVFTAGVFTQIALGELAETERRPVFYVGAVKAALGAISTPILSARIATPRPLSDRPCDDLIELRAALASGARREARGVAWYQHFPGVAVNAAGILYLGLAHDLWVESLLGAALGTVVGELKLWTQPQGAIRAQRALRLNIGPGFAGVSGQF